MDPEPVEGVTTAGRGVLPAHLGRWSTVVAVAATVGFALELIPGVTVAPVLRDVVLYNVVFGAAAVAAGARAVVEPERRRPWVALAWGMALQVSSNVYYSLVIGPMDEPPYPSWADVGYLAYFPLIYVAMLSLLRQRVARWHPSVWLDGLIGAIFSAAVISAAVFDSVLALSGERIDVTLTNLAYPVGDMLLLATAIGGVALLANRLDPEWALLGAGVLAMGVGDVAFSLLDAAGTYTEGGALDLLWLMGAVLITAAAAGHPARPGTTVGPLPVRSTHWTVMGVPLMGTLAAICLLAPPAGPHVSAVGRWLAVGGLLVVAVRTALTYREVLSLADARRLASTDELTGLLNRRGFATHARLTLHGHQPNGERRRLDDDAYLRFATPPAPTGSALLMLDLDRFKEVNDSLGHGAGDILLIEVAHRLQVARRGPQDVLARLGGDEFAVLLDRVDRFDAERVATRIRAALSEPFELDGIRVHAAASIGIAMAPQHGDGLSVLMRRADIAMYRAKAASLGHAVYDPHDADADHEDRVQRIDALRRALETDQLVLHYQPKINLPDGLVTSVEALVRWDHPTRGLVYPEAFLPLVEDAGLMPTLTTWVLTRAVEQVAAWTAAGVDLCVAVNLAPSSVVDRELPNRVGALLAQHHVPPHRLIFEITEESLLGDRVRARDVLARLRATGIRISIDDYGAGYSSLAYLRELPVDELKLDRSFIFPMADDARAAAIVRSTVDLAHSLGLHIVAEGVEHQAAATELVSYGCDAAQGFLFTRALPATELTWWLEHRTTRPRPPDPATHQTARTSGPPATG